MNESREPRILLWDIECNNLDADWGTVLCIGYKWLGEKKVSLLTVRDYEKFYKDPTYDEGLIADFLEVYNSADVTIAYNGILFDRAYVLAKVLEYNMEVPPNITMIDPYFTVKSNLRLSSKSLQNVLRHLRLENDKTPVEKRIWKRAGTGHIPSIRYIERHCVSDVKVLEEAYLRLRPLMRTHPRVGQSLGECRFCGAGKLQRRGRVVTRLKGEVQRVQCRACAGWDTRNLKELVKYNIKGVKGE